MGSQFQQKESFPTDFDPVRWLSPLARELAVVDIQPTTTFILEDLLQRTVSPSNIVVFLRPHQYASSGFFLSNASRADACGLSADGQAQVSALVSALREEGKDTPRQNDGVPARLKLHKTSQIASQNCANVRWPRTVAAPAAGRVGHHAVVDLRPGQHEEKVGHFNRACSCGGRPDT